jgi:hypothetical protein
MDQRQLAYLQDLKLKVARQEAFLNSKEKFLNDKERIQRQGLRPLNGPFGSQDSSSNNGVTGVTQNLESNFDNTLDPGMRPGNVGSLNRVIWPFFFTTNLVELPPNTAQTSSFTITQEACFVWMSFVKVVMLEDELCGLTYIDPDVAGSGGEAPGLSITIRDSQSSRDFQNTNINLDAYGNPRFPMIFPRPMLFTPNSNIQIGYQNQHDTNVYVPRVTAFGYRIRVEDAGSLLSTVYA